MVEEAADELLGRQGGGLLFLGLPILVAKSDLAILEFEDPAVAEGDAEDVGGEIFQGGLAAAD